MDKLQYDSLYKFFVSLGLVLIILPFATMVYLFNVEPVLISQVEYDLLSGYSLSMIENRNSLYILVIGILRCLGPFSFLTGCVFLVFGTVKWNANQRKLDKKLDNETTMQTLSLMEMSTKEVDAKVEKEIKEATVEVTGDTPKIPVHSQSTMIAQFREIEDLCLNYFIKKYGRKYTFKRDIRMGKYDYDFIGVSKKDSIDLLIEIKYWKDISVVNRGLIDTCRRLNDACENYHTIAHRDFSGIVFIVTPDEQLSKLESVVERYTERALHGTNNKIMIQCVGESIVK